VVAVALLVLRRRCCAIDARLMHSYMFAVNSPSEELLWRAIAARARVDYTATSILGCGGFAKAIRAARVSLGLRPVPLTGMKLL
jgi:hypothetical protein